MTSHVYKVVMLALAIFVLAGCQEPNYRIETVDKGEGRVELHRVPKTAEELAREAGPTTATARMHERLDELEATVRRQNEEISALQRQLGATTAPTTSK
jgi:hypothetical protein